MRTMSRRQRAFTLIEILVVVVIVGIVMTVAVLSLSLVSGGQDLREEARRIMTLVRTAQDESMMQGREFGVEFMKNSYRFVEFDPIANQWSEVPGDDTLRMRELPEELQFELWMEDRRVLLKDEPSRMQSEEDNRSRIQAYAPHVYIFSSGDITPFELHLLREIDEQVVTLRADEFGRVDYVTDEDGM